MRLQIVFVLLIGIIAALNSNYYNDPHEYEDTYSNDYYENYDETIMTSKGMSNNIFFAKPILILNYEYLSEYS